MVLMCSVLFWVVALTAVGRCTALLLRVENARRWAGPAALVALLAGSALLFFRPHEEILGGEDPGAYVNASVAFSRQAGVFHQDPLLAQVPEADRPAFFYGHEGFGLTKDACRWVRDVPTAMVGPWFQPAYPVMMSLLARLGPAWLVLYGAPLLTWLATLALASLGAQLLERRGAGVLAALFFVLNPVVFWNARSPRAELGALLFLWAGLALVAHAWRSPGERRLADFLLGSICLLLAPLFHITAWYGIVPFVAVLLVKAFRGRRLFTLAIPLACGGAALFVWYLRKVTDCYHLLRFLGPWAAPSPGRVSAVALAAAALLGLALWRAGGSRGTVARPRYAVAGVLLALAVGAFLLSWWGRGPQGRVPLLPVCAWTRSLILADLRGFGQLVSRTALLAGLAGWGALLFRRGTHADLRLGLCAALLPALLLSGWMNNYMMETRRMLIFHAPMLGLCLAALVVTVASRGRRGATWIATGMTVLLLAAMLHGRTHLLRQTDFAGSYRFFERMADPIRAHNGLLLVEYSKAGAPLEHLFGIPTLELDNEYHATSYAQAETAWARLMKLHPGRDCFFLTPFQQPFSARFVFQPVRRATLATTALARELHELPRRILPYEETYTLYRMQLRTAEHAGTAHGRVPYRFQPDAGNMGLRGFANVRNESWSLRGLALTAGVARDVPLATADGPPLTTDGLYFFFHGPFTPIRRPRLEGLPADAVRQDWLWLADEWWVLRLRGSALRIPRQLELSCPEDGLLADVQLLRDGVFTSVAGAWPAAATVERQLPPIRVRWTLAQAELVLPAPSGPDGELFLYFAAPEAVGPQVSLSVAALGQTAVTARAVRTGPPQWLICRAAAIGLLPPQAVMTLATDPPWNSGVRGYPDDLGILLGCVVVAE